MKRLAQGRTLQRGQALVLALGLLLLGVLALRLLFESGQYTAARQRLLNTADAAALSAATWRARVLNFHAYSNRAIIANEVAIAQAVTLLAWSQYFETLTRNASALGAYWPPAEPVLSAVAEAAHLAAESARLTAELEIPARGAPSLGYKSLLQTSQEVMHLSSLGFALNMVTAEVARASDATHFAWVLPELAPSWSGFTARAEEGPARARVAALVRASLDAFVSGPRSEDIHTPIPSPCLNLNRLRKRGVTTLSDALDRWEAVDTLSFHLRRLSWFRCREREALPLGWGAAEAGTAQGGVISEGGEILLNPAARQRASEALWSHSQFDGIARVRELNYESLASTEFPTARLAVMARTVPPGGASGRMWALAAAEVYFQRPPGAPVRTEYASLFNPYWQARLVAPSLTERAQALQEVE